MSIKPALGWLALLLFTTAAQAEGTRELVKDSAKTPGALTTPVTPKTKAPGVAPVSARTGAGALVVLESVKPQVDYEAEIYSGVPLDGDLAKGRGVAKGLVFMVFERERRATFRIAKDKIRRIVRLAPQTGVSVVSMTTADKPAPAARRERWDVLDTQDGIVVVATTTTNAGIFTTSDVYVFQRGASLAKRVAAVEALPAQAQGRVREALVVADWKR